MPVNAPHESWRQILRGLPEDSSSDIIPERAQSLFKLLKAEPDLLEYIVGEVITQAIETPKKTDSLLSVYRELATLCKSEKDIKACGFKGDMAVHKALDVELLEMSQTAGVPIDDYHPYDVTCPISSEQSTESAIQKVIAFGEARRHWMIVHVLNGRSRSLGVGQEAHADIPLREDFTLTTILNGLGLDSDATPQDESNFLGSLLIILSTGKTLEAKATSDEDKKLFSNIRHTLEDRLRNEPKFKFKFKYFIAHALEALLPGGKEWSSVRIFYESTWVH